MSKSNSLLMAKRLKELREEKKLSHVSLSKALKERYDIDISRDSLMSYEVSDPHHTKAYKNEGMRVEYLRCLADFYCVSADYLLGFTNDQNREASAVDDLGLSPSVVKRILMSKECSEDNELQDKQLNNKVKSCIFDNCYSTHGALNMILERMANNLICIHIAQLARRIYCADGTALPANLNPDNELGALIGKCEAEALAVGEYLTDELNKLRPELAGLFRVVSGVEDIRYEIEFICTQFRLIVEEVTGYNEYIIKNIMSFGG